MGVPKYRKIVLGKEEMVEDDQLDASQEGD
jgi:hypothetical protein